MRSFPVLALVAASILTFSASTAAFAAEATAAQKQPSVLKADKGQADKDVAGGSASLPADTVAEVNGAKITKDLLDKVMQQAPAGTQSDDPKVRRQVLDKLIEVEMVAQEAQKEGLDKDPDFVMSLDMMRKQQLYVALVRKKVLDAVKVTPEEVKAYYDANKDQFVSGEEVHASHILVDTEAEAKAIKAQLDKGADFAKLAKDKSKCPSASRGGDLGYFGKGKMVPEFEKAAFALKVGQISGPVKTQFGWHIIKVLDKKDSKVKSLDEVKAEIEQKLLQEKQKKAYDDLLASLKSKMDVKINEASFKAPEAEKPADAKAAVPEKKSEDKPKQDENKK